MAKNNRRRGAHGDDSSSAHRSQLGAEDTEPEEGIHEAEVITESEAAVQIGVSTEGDEARVIVWKRQLPDDLCRVGARFNVEMLAGNLVKIQRCRGDEWIGV